MCHLFTPDFVWGTKIPAYAEGSKWRTYKLFKNCYCTENYLNFILSRKNKCGFAWFKTCLLTTLYTIHPICTDHLLYLVYLTEIDPPERLEFRNCMKVIVWFFYSVNPFSWSKILISRTLSSCFACRHKGSFSYINSKYIS